MRYFVELELPAASVETALEDMPAEWLVALANRAHARAIRFLLEAEPESGADLANGVVELNLQPASRHGSTTSHKMAWALIGPRSARSLLDADLEVGSLGHRRSQLALAGRYWVPVVASTRHLDRGTAQRVGEATIKEFAEQLAGAVEKLALGVPAVRLPVARAPGWPVIVV